MKRKIQTFLLVPAFLLSVSACQKLIAEDPAVTKIGGDLREQSQLTALVAPPLGTLVDSGIYRLRGLSSLPAGPVVEVTGNSTADNVKIQQWPWFPNNGQKWQLIKTDATYYKLVNLTSQKCLQSPSTTSGEQLQQHTDDGSDSERWSISYSSANDAYSLTNKATGLIMVVSPENASSGTKIRQTNAVTGTQNLFQFRNLNFLNPLANGSRADPFVAQKDGLYYFLFTQGSKISIIKTPSMALLNNYPVVTVYTPPTGTAYSSALWAPELHLISGKWYIYFAADDGADANHRMYVLENSSADPTTGTWTFKGKIYDSTYQWAIDGTVLTIGTSNYFVWSGWEDIATKWKQHLYIAPMSNPWTISGPRVKISSPTNTWEKYESTGTGLGVNEGPIALRKDATSPVFIIYSASRYGSDNYCLGQIQLTSGSSPTVATSWFNKKQVLTRNDAGGVFGPGHNGFFTSSYTDANGTFRMENWLVYHARSTVANPGGTRTPRMQKFTWNSDGSPNFGTAAPINIKIPVPVGE
jgi:GH43 family beta-xylosidase